jgi:DNA-binding Lrp family transcriptional regulator
LKKKEETEMAKSSREKMTQDEAVVLDILEHHAKESIENIAKRCGFSRQKVWRIIKHLEENKIIWGYTAVADDEVKNLEHFVLLVKRTILPIEEQMKKEIVQEKLDDYLSPSVSIENIYYTHGRYDVVITFYAPDLITAKKVIDAISQRIGKYFEEYLLLETLFPVRKQSIKNPQIKKLAEFI